jgi:small subunit ribosomal protein S8
MDIVADSLVRIKNGYMAQKDEVVLSYSKLVGAICEVLKKEGYIASWTENIVGDRSSTSGKNKVISGITVVLQYNDRKPAMTEIQRISKPGLRVYKGANSLPYVLSGLGMALISTPKGVMTDKAARKARLGGEVMAYIW